MPFYVGNVISRAFDCTGVGIVDPTFIDPDINNIVNVIAIQADQKIVIGGTFTTVAGVTQNRIARLNYDGTLDTTFNILSQGPIGASNSVNDLVIQPDGKIIVVGNFQQMRGVFQYHVCRLNTDGSLDTTFNVGAASGTSGGLTTVALQPNGDIVIGGGFTTAGGIVQNNIARLIQPDGIVDTGFNTGVAIGLDGIPRDILVQPDGKILVGGNFARARGIVQNDIARLNTDGSLDTGFNAGTNPGVVGGIGVFKMALQPDGKIILVGDWNSFRGTVLNNNSPEIARSNTNGTRDTTWTTGPRPNNSVWTCELQYDGKVFTGGPFTAMRGVASTYFARLQDNGNLDATYNVAPPTQGVTATVPGGYIYCSALQDDCKILIGGDFTEVRGSTRHRVARLA